MRILGVCVSQPLGNVTVVRTRKVGVKGSYEELEILEAVASMCVNSLTCDELWDRKM